MRKINFMGSSRLTAVAAALLGGTVLFLASCQKPTCSNCNFSQNSNNNGNNTQGTTTPTGTFTVTPGAALNAFNLGTTQTFPVTITADSNYSGTVDLSVTETELQALDKGLSIKFSFNPSSVTLTPNGSATSTVTVTVPTLAPDFASSLFHVVGSDSAGGYSAQASENLAVHAIFNVYLDNPTGASPEKWSVPANSIVQFVNHPAGLTVNFMNLDMSAKDLHRIHSDAGTGTIQHQPGDLAESLDGTNPNPTGGTYSQTVTIQTGGSNTIYCHNDESGSQARIFQYNVPVTLPSPSPTPAAATFTQVNHDVIQASCISCHGASYQTTGGGNNLQNYTAVKGLVDPGNASASVLYLAVSGNPPSMPEGGTPLSATLLLELSSWINSGAPNN